MSPRHNTVKNNLKLYCYNDVYERKTAQREETHEINMKENLIVSLILWVFLAMCETVKHTNNHLIVTAASEASSQTFHMGQTTQCYVYITKLC